MPTIPLLFRTSEQLASQACTALVPPHDEALALPWHLAYVVRQFTVMQSDCIIRTVGKKRGGYFDLMRNCSGPTTRTAWPTNKRLLRPQ